MFFYLIFFRKLFFYFLSVFCLSEGYFVMKIVVFNLCYLEVIKDLIRYMMRNSKYFGRNGFLISIYYLFKNFDN